MTQIIALDAMGGDRAPGEIVTGACDALREDPAMAVALVGRREEIEPLLAAAGAPADRVTVRDARDVIGCDENPAESFRRRKDSSIQRCAEMVRDGEAAAMVSAGSTGGAVAAATLVLRLLPGVRRPGIAVALPSGSGVAVMIDVGANIYCKPLHLFHYGVMAAEYSRRLLGKPNPTIGLLNIGTEDQKGNDLVRETRELYARSTLNFIGHIEGNNVFNGTCDVIVCEGFVGNVVLKVAEGLSEAFFRRLRDDLTAANPADQSVVGRFLARFQNEHDYAEYGAAPLLGVNGLCMISHGRSDARAIRSALRVTRRLVTDRLVQHMMEGLAASPVA